LNELHADIKEVNKIAGEPTVNVRKLGNKRMIFSDNKNSENQENKPENV